MIQKIEQINKEGSAYNLIGLTLNVSIKPNIMYCSEFVYCLLDYADATYFDKNDAKVKPTDFVELDYYRKVSFEYEIIF